jgi:hypothetical protein
MKTAIRFNKDYYGGALVILVGLVTTYASVSYPLGSLSSMGPGFFPCAIGVLMSVVGALIALSARVSAPDKEDGMHPKGMPDIRGGVCIILSIVAFVIVGEYFGLLPATFAIVFISALGDRGNSWLQAFVLSVVMMVVAAVVFYWGLRLQLAPMKWEF